MKTTVRVLILVALFLVGSTVATLKKCCPSGEVVQIDVIENPELSSKNHFKCVKHSPIQSKVKSKRESEKYAMKNSSSVAEMIAYNVLIDEHSHWPSCGENSVLSQSALNDPLKASQSASCVDIFNGFFNVFACEERVETFRDFVGIYKLRKCCDKNSSFDIFSRRCVSNNGSLTMNETFREFLGDKIVVFESGLPECMPDDVLVEYHSLVHNLLIHENSLVIKTMAHHGPDLFKSFCVDAALNPETLPPNSEDNKNLHLKASSKWMAKVCRPKSICRELPCIRKCCREGFRMAHINETICEPHDRHLNVQFHFFDIRESPEEPNTMEPTGEH